MGIIVLPTLVQIVQSIEPDGLGLKLSKGGIDKYAIAY